MHRLTVLLFLLVAAPASGQTSPSSLPRLPFERPEPCANYCEPDWVACRTVTLYAAPRPGSRVVTRIPRRTHVRVVDGLMRNERAGLVIFRGPMVYAAHRVIEDGSGRELGVDTSARTFTSRDTLYLVDHITDGDGDWEYRWFFRGRYERGQPFWARWPEDAEPPALIVRKPAQVWWVSMRTPGGVTAWAAFDPDDWSGEFPKYEDPSDNCAK
jgi:hypothetical protein